LPQQNFDALSVGTLLFPRARERALLRRNQCLSLRRACLPLCLCRLLRCWKAIAGRVGSTQLRPLRQRSAQLGLVSLEEV
jgi:hypothetical protein